MFPFKPNEDRVVIETEQLPDKSRGGLWIPDAAKGKPRTGKVVAVGPGKACTHCGLPHPVLPEVGAYVLFPENGGTEISILEKQYVIIRASDIQLYENPK